MTRNLPLKYYAKYMGWLCLKGKYIQMKFVDEVRDKFDSKFPFSLLSNVILYRNDRKDTDLFANEIDCLFHYENNGKDHLVIVEVKDRNDIYGDTQSQPPTKESSWKLIYNDNEIRKEKDIKKQVEDQAESLRQFCQNIPKSAPVMIEEWIVHKGKHIRPVVADRSNDQLKLLTIEGFKDHFEPASLIFQYVSLVRPNCRRC